MATSLSPGERILREKIEPSVDNFHKSFPLFTRDRDVALIHLLRYFEDQIRIRTPRALFERGEFEFFLALRYAQDGLAWATRWVWDECPRISGRTLELDREVYGEAAELFAHSIDYYRLYSRFVTYSRNHFDVNVDLERKVVRFSFKSDREERIDTARQIREIRKDATESVSGELWSFLDDWIPLLRDLFPGWLEQIDENSVRYRVPPEISWVFARWAGLHVPQMRFDLPGTWQFGSYSLDEFRAYWTSLNAAALLHKFVHTLGDRFMVGSVVISLSQAELETLSAGFSIPIEACRAIIEDLTYSPTPKSPFWDPIWQPLLRLNDESILISPSLVTGSSPERNLILVLNKRAEKKNLYDLVSGRKEEEQLSELENLFTDMRFMIRKRVKVPRNDGGNLTDIDLLVFDRVENFVLIAQVKWLLRPDYATEVLAKDEEISDSLMVMRRALARISTLGVQWLSQVLDTDLGGQPLSIGAILINRDFLPSGWVCDNDVPVVDNAFLHDYMGSNRFAGLKSLHSAACQLDESLAHQFPANLAYGKIQVGEYSFESPILRPLNRPD